MSGIPKSIDDLSEQINLTIEALEADERRWLETVHPIYRAAYIETRRDADRRIRNKILYGNEEGIKDE